MAQALWVLAASQALWAWALSHVLQALSLWVKALWPALGTVELSLAHWVLVFRVQALLLAP